MKMSKLFHICAWNEVEYQEAGDDVNYGFLEEGDILYIFFQGSSSISDWVRNFLFPAKPYKDMGIPYRVHRGFLAAWKEVEDIIIDKITETVDNRPPEEEQPYWEQVLIPRKKDYKWKHIVVVGYSHGGALAAFCHECVWYRRPDLREGNRLEGYGFEAPRIYAGWRVKKALRERWANFKVIRNKCDIVTHCPPAIFRFCHVGELIKIGKGLPTKDYKKPVFIGAHYWDKVYESLLFYERFKEEKTN